MMPRTHRSAHGFTLIELMITVAVIAILSTAAFSTYRSQVIKSQRTDARTALLTIVNQQQLFFAEGPPGGPRYSYTTDLADLNWNGTTTRKGYYNLTLAACPGGGLTQCVLITATPVSGGSQAADAACTQFSADTRGNTTATGSDAANCW